MARPRALRRLMIYAHDTYGLGHLRRSLAIAEAVLAPGADWSGPTVSRPRPRVLLASGSPVADRYRRPAGLTIVPLPAVVKVGPEQYASREDGLSFGLVRRARTATLLDLVRRYRPDVFLVDHAPLGMGGELVEVFDQLRHQSPQTRLVLGLRDILDEPAAVRRTWVEQGVYPVLEEVYDRILVYGSPDVFDVAEAYDLPADVTSRLSYTGYVTTSPVPPAPDDRGRHPARRPPAGRPAVVATAGGGGDGYPLLAATIQAAGRTGAICLAITGPLMPADQRGKLAELAAGTPGARVCDFVADPSALFADADVVVTMGGYNTLCEVVRQGVPAVVVPRTEPRREQELRARLFAQRHLVRVVDPGEGLASRLGTALAEALERGPGPEPGCRPLDLGGAWRVRGVLDEEAALAGQVQERTVSA
ncbi:MAG: glycosyltransferase family protein [Actinomycetes bacterium]